MPREPSRPEKTSCAPIGAWSALLILLLAVALACSDGEVAATAKPRPVHRVKLQQLAAKVAVITPSPIATLAPTQPPTPEPTPPPTPEPPPPPTVMPQTPPPAPVPVYVPPPPPPPPPPAAAYNDLSTSVMSLINERRSQGGLNALTPNAALMAAAQRYAELHFAAGPYQLSHTLDGMPSDRAARAGYSGGAGEVIVTAGPSAQLLTDVLMASPPHASIIMGDGYSDVGVGCAIAPYTGVDGITWNTALCVGMMGVPY